MNKELGTNENKAVVVEVLSWYIPGVSEENNKHILKQCVIITWTSVEFEKISLYHFIIIILYLFFI